MNRLHLRTPTLQASGRFRHARRHHRVKAEYLQPGGSFKIRGIGLLCQRAAAGGARSFVCASGGNAGVAVAYAGRMLGLPVTVVVPITTSEAAAARIEDLGAAVIRSGNEYTAARDHAVGLAQAQGARYVPPFDHPDLWEGHASLIDEAVADVEFDAVVCSVGGGGLLAGIVAGLRTHRPTVPVIAVETEGAASLAAALAAGRVVELPSVDTVATSLAARAICQQAYTSASTYDVRPVVVSDAEAIEACIAYADSERVLVEPACGAALSLLSTDHPALHPFRAPLVIACGGVGISTAMIERWRGERAP